MNFFNRELVDPRKKGTGSMWNYSFHIVECFKGCSCVELFWCSKSGRGRLENCSARGKCYPVRECGASGRTAVSDLRRKEKFHEFVRPGAAQEKSYRNREVGGG